MDEIKIGAEHFAAVHASLYGQVAVGIHGAGGAGSGYSAGEIERREGIELFNGGEWAIAGRGIENVFVHADDAGNQGFAGGVNDFCAARDLYACGCAYRGDFSVVNYYGLIELRRGTGAVNQFDVRQDDDGGALGDEIWR